MLEFTVIQVIAIFRHYKGKIEGSPVVVSNTKV